jgi:predicted transcriptional regulator
MVQTSHESDLITRTAEIVSAYVSKNSVPAASLSALIGSVHQSLTGLVSGPAESTPQPVPAVPVKKSVHHDYIICLEDGKKFKSLKRHLGVHYGLTPAEYRQKWNLPADYPMVAPAYAAARSTLAKQMGLGRKPKEPEAPPPARRQRRKPSA